MIRRSRNTWLRSCGIIAANGRSDNELQSMSDVELAKPDWILFNGGVLESSQIKLRIEQAIAAWFAGNDSIAGDWKVGVLDGDRLDVAVSRGAAYFGQVRRGDGVRIEAKLARSYYVMVSQSPPRGVCVIPGSASPGDKFQLDAMPFELAVGQPVQFPVAYSSTRLADRVGECYRNRRAELCALAADSHGARIARQTSPRAIARCARDRTQSNRNVATVVRSQRTRPQRWKLEFDVRASTETDRIASDSVAGAKRYC